MERFRKILGFYSNVNELNTLKQDLTKIYRKEVENKKDDLLNEINDMLASNILRHGITKGEKTHLMCFNYRNKQPFISSDKIKKEYENTKNDIQLSPNSDDIYSLNMLNYHTQCTIVRDVLNDMVVRNNIKGIKNIRCIEFDYDYNMYAPILVADLYDE
jgi:hypothetical protein